MMAPEEEHSTPRKGSGNLLSKYRTQDVLGRAFFLILGCASLSLAAAKMFRGEFMYYSNNLTEPGFQFYFPLAVLGAFFIYVGVRRKKAPNNGRSRSDKDGGSADGS
jgi:hypothetical protein